MNRRRATLLALLAAAALARGDAVPAPLPWSVEARGGRVLTNVDLAQAFPADLRRLLSNGLTNVIALHVALLPEGGDAPVALYGREVDVLYDVWEETYGVTVKDPAAPRGRARTFASFDALAAFLADARGIDLGPVSQLDDGRWVVQTRLEVNPVSKELLARTREFIANPAAGRGAPSRSMLGAMAGYLLGRADPGSEVHQFRSPPFTAREVAR